MPEFTLNMYQTAGVAMLLFVLGRFLTNRIEFLKRCCIPAPVVGGLIFAIVHLVLYSCGVVQLSFDDNVKSFFMTLFFTSVGYTACFRLLKQGGKKVFTFLLVAIVMVCLQDVVGAALAKVFGWDMRLGLCTGSIPMVGGHGTAGAFGPVLEDFGIQGATTLCTAAATYGLIAGSMMGGPIGKMLIERHNLLATVVPEDDSLLVEEEMKHERHTTMYPAASFQLIVAMGIGTVLSRLLSLTGMTFPIYIGAMIAAAIIPMWANTAASTPCIWARSTILEASAFRCSWAWL